MNSNALICSCAALLLVPALARAQQPPSRQPSTQEPSSEQAKTEAVSPPAGPVILLTLKAMLAQSLYVIEPLHTEGTVSKHPGSGSSGSGAAAGTTPGSSTAPGTAANYAPDNHGAANQARPVARIRDLLIDADGKITALLLALPTDSGANAEPHLLVVGNVRWEPQLRVLVTDLTESALGGLSRYETHAEAAATAPAPTQPVFLASNLTIATVYCGADRTSLANQATALWMAPSALRLAFATVAAVPDDHAGTSRCTPFLVPAGAIRLVSIGGNAVFELATDRQRIDSAPKVTDAILEPDAAMRQRCYQHFGVARPTWEDAKPRAASNPTPGDPTPGK